MTFAVYTDNVPNPPNNPSADVGNMQTNTMSIANLIEIDHIGFNQTNGGYHTVAHFPVQGSDPTPVSSTGELYAKLTTGPVGNDDMFWQNGSGNVIRMTMGFVPSAASNGYSFLPGGLIIQWGVIAPNSNVTNTVTFTSVGNIDFPNAIFNVQFSPQRTTVDPGTTYEFYIDNTTVSTTGFNLLNRSTHTYGFYWFAIGN